MIPVDEAKRYVETLRFSVNFISKCFAIALFMFLLFDFSSFIFYCFSFSIFVYISTAGWTLALKRKIKAIVDKINSTGPNQDNPPSEEQKET